MNKDPKEIIKNNFRKKYEINFLTGKTASEN